MGKNKSKYSQLSKLEKKIEKIEPHLNRTQWGAMTYMLIPSMLNSAKNIRDELKPLKKNNEWGNLLFQKIDSLIKNWNKYQKIPEKARFSIIKKSKRNLTRTSVVYEYFKLIARNTK